MSSILATYSRGELKKLILDEFKEIDFSCFDSENNSKSPFLKKLI